VNGCAHPDFAAEVDVIRLEDIGAFSADVRIHCTGCGENFTFVGVEPGLSSEGPRVSISGLEVHLPIRPESDHDTPLGHYGFSVGIIAARKPIS